MAVKYYRPQKRGGLQIASTKRFLISIAIIAAIVVLIVLLATQPWNNADSGESAADGDQQANATDTVPASDETADNVLDNATETTDDATSPETSSDGQSTASADAASSADADAEAASESDKSDSDSSGSSSKSYKTLKQGSEGDAVKKLQDRLSELGYLPGKSTGYYGSVTVRCVKEFQEKNGLDADGIAGSKTQSKLYSDSAVAK